MSLQKWCLLVVAFNTHAKTATLTTPILQLYTPVKKFFKNWLLSPPGGALTTYPYKLRQKNVALTAPQIATPMFSIISIIPFVYISDFFMSTLLCRCIVTSVILAHARVRCVQSYSVAVSHAAVQGCIWRGCRGFDPPQEVADPPVGGRL